MALIVQKYGGTSVGTPERIQAVAEKVIHYRDQGNQIVVVVSAMSGETDRLLDLAGKISFLAKLEVESILKCKRIIVPLGPHFVVYCFDLIGSLFDIFCSYQ